MKRYLFAVVALFLAIGFSAFENSERLLSDLVWFETNDAGTSLDNPTTGGIQGDNPPAPYACGSPLTVFCARAYKISQSDVIDNGDGTFSLASGKNVVTDSDANRKKP